ncbi:hypothetical protein GCM10026983_41750 [Gracilibacillus alcaliphilus]
MEIFPANSRMIISSNYIHLCSIIQHFDKYQDKLVMPIHAYYSDVNSSTQAALGEQTIEDVTTHFPLTAIESLPLETYINALKQVMIIRLRIILSEMR